MNPNPSTAKNKLQYTKIQWTSRVSNIVFRGDRASVAKAKAAVVDGVVQNITNEVVKGGIIPLQVQEAIHHTAILQRSFAVRKGGDTSRKRDRYDDGRDTERERHDKR